jgi:hypothetical protein
MGGGGPVGAVGDIVGGIADVGGDIVGGIGDIAGGIADALPADIVGPALTAWNPYAGALYYGIQGDPFSAAMSFAPVPGGASPFTKMAPKFLQQAGASTLQKQIQDTIIKTAMREGIGFLGEKTGLMPDSDQSKAMATPFTTGVNLGEGILPQSGDMLAQGMLGQMGESLGPIDLSRVQSPTDLIKILAEQGLGTGWLPKKKDGTTDWKKVMKWVGIGGAGLAGLYALSGGMQGTPQELPEKTQEYWAGYDYGDPLATSGQKGSILGDLAYVTDPETGKIIGFEDMPGAQTILGRYKEFTENLEGADKEAFEEAQSASHGGLMSLAGGGFPRQTGAINGPGTATSDSIPAMLSDGEFVMTADAVRGAGMGNRMDGAKRMYNMMNKFEGMA